MVAVASSTVTILWFNSKFIKIFSYSSLDGSIENLKKSAGFDGTMVIKVCYYFLKGLKKLRELPRLKLFGAMGNHTVLRCLK